ncbi:MAG: lipid-A-disaccharide synthase, partial [Candidatus Omnitrophica bacterium]|nr:lipid-A-disaccharide synthase [Candidatus Omnitrophota bacterium]
IRTLFEKFNKEISKGRIDLAILVDYPGFNLILAKMLKKRTIPCIYYITPQIWAWGAWRTKALRRYIKKAITILKFEEDFLKQNRIDATSVGHPLLDEHYEFMPIRDAKSSLGLNPNIFTIALIPGSRSLEVERMLPVMLKTAGLIKKSKDVQFIISQSPNVDEKIYKDICKGFDAPLVKSNIYKCLNAADFVFASSGTVTLQIAIAEKPMLITYITSSFTYLLAKIFVKIPYVGLVNIIAKKFIIPEILQYEARPKRLAQKILQIISSENEMNNMRGELRRVKNSLGSPGASKRAAQIINKML